MRLKRRDWALVSEALARCDPFWSQLPTLSKRQRKRMEMLFFALGELGSTAAAQGIDPVDGPPRYALVHALRTVAAAINAIPSEAVSDDLCEALVRCEDVLAACDGIASRS